MKLFRDKRVCRSIIGATWTLPLRYLTLSAQIAAVMLVSGIEMQIETGVLWASLTAGVLTGWVLRMIDNLLNEFFVFAAIIKFLQRK